MPSGLPPVPHRVPVIGLDGLLAPVWGEWLQKVFLRIGGNISYTNDELGNISTSMIQDSAVTEAKLAASVAGGGLTGGAGTALAVNPDGSTLEVVSDQVRIKDLGVVATKLAADAVSYVKLLNTDWTNSKASNGYQKLPSGIYLQWGTTTGVASGSSISPTFPATFPNACLQVISCIRDNSANATTATGQSGNGGYTTTGFTIYNRTSLTQTFSWFAVGY